MPVASIGTPALWIGFFVFVLAMLAIDLGVFHRKAHSVTLREASVWSAIWVTLSLVFAVGVYFWFGTQRALEFTTGYLVEKALSVDNIFVFVVVFAAFAIPPAYQHRVLFWGVLGALVTRAIFIVVGGALLSAFHWATYVFGAILVFTGIKLFTAKQEATVHPEKNLLVRLVQRVLPVVPRTTTPQFTVMENGRRHATPLLLALVAVEGTDIVFAVDSIPAIFAITTDPFIVFTSNIFAILGLRSMYFLLAGILEKFRYLKMGLASVLVFVGAKMALAGVYKLPVLTSLLVIAALLGGSIALSLLRGVPPPDSRPAPG